MKKIFSAAWILLTVLFIASVFTGGLNAFSMVAFSFAALGLVYALILWVIVDNSRNHTTG